MKTTILTAGAFAAGLALAGGAVWAASDGHGPGAMHGQMHDQMQGNGQRGMGQGIGQGMGMGQGMNMGAMMHGGDASAAERGDIHDLFADHDAIARTVTNLPNGIRTVTESDDPKLAQTIQTHVADMMKRVAEKRDPGLPIESPALRAIFENYDKIETKVETTEKGVIVTQTSADTATVALLQKHASEVTAFAEKGMAAAHDGMAENNSMPGAMRGRGGMNMTHMMGQMQQRMQNQMHERGRSN